MRHPTEGMLRRLLDEPAAVADADRQHVTGCAQCLADLAAARQDAVLVEAALVSGGAADVDVSAAWQRLTAAAAAPVPEPVGRRPVPAGPSRFAGLLRRPAAAGLAVAVVLAGAGTAAANDWLPIFRTEQVAPVTLSTSDLVALPDLEAYGELELTDEPVVGSVNEASVATDRTGVQVPQVRALPSGVSGEPIYQVVGAVSATFTFSAERAAQAAAESGDVPRPPDGLDGSSVRLDAGPGVAQIWTSSSGAPALLVGRAVAPTAFSSGAEFEVLRDYLLSLPGLPADVAAQLRTFSEDGSTLPLPLPGDEVTTSSTQVNGLPATVVQTRDRSLTGVVWVEDGMVTVVAGSLDDDEVLTIAEDLE